LFVRWRQNHARGQNCYKSVMGGKEPELSPLSEEICEQSLVQIKPWPTYQNNRCWITCWRSHWSRPSPASKDCSKCRACRGADLQSGRTWNPQASSGNWAANICTLALLFVADVIRDKLFAGVQHMTFFQVVCLRQSCWSYVAPSSVLSVYYDEICIKFASHHWLLYVVYMCQKSLNFTYYQQKCKWLHFSWATL